MESIPAYDNPTNQGPVFHHTWYSWLLSLFNTVFFVEKSYARTFMFMGG